MYLISGHYWYAAGVSSQVLQCLLHKQLYRLKKKRSIGGSKRVFFTEEGLHDLIERNTRGAATIEKITQGQKLGRRGLRNRTSRASRIIKAVRDSNNAMVSFERIVFKAKQLNDKGVLTDSRGENLATAATNYMFVSTLEAERNTT